MRRDRRVALLVGSGLLVAGWFFGTQSEDPHHPLAREVALVIGLVELLLALALVVIVAAAAQRPPDVGIQDGGLGRRGRTSDVVSRRLVARCIDEAFVLFFQVVFTLAAAVLMGLREVAADEDRGQVAQLALAIAAFGWLVGVVYEVLATRAGAGVGKMVCGLRIVDARSGARISWLSSVLRWLLVSGVQPLIWLLLGIGSTTPMQVRTLLGTTVVASLLWRGLLAWSAATSLTGQGLHDRLVYSRVIRANQRNVAASNMNSSAI